MAKEYIIIGDTDKYEGCLVYVGFHSKESAEQDIQRILTNPTENDKKVTKGHSNLRVKEVNSEDCWWNYNCD